MSVGNFKVKYMEGLKKKGLEIYAAYGNTGGWWGGGVARAGGVGWRGGVHVCEGGEG